MINPKHFRELIIRPTLKYLDLWSESAENLLLGTAVHESLLYHLKQIEGPALGVYQIEPKTYEDVWDNWLRYRPQYADKIRNISEVWPKSVKSLPGNLYYSTGIARIIYYRVPEPLPDPDDVVGLAEYWKKHFNTELGKGRIEDWIEHYSEIA